MTGSPTIETIRRRVREQLIDSNFHLMTKIGVIMIVLVTYRPFYVSNFIPALLIYILITYYRRKPDLSKRHKCRVIHAVIGLALFVAFNTVLQIFPVPAAESAWGSVTTILTEEKVTLAMCNIGQFIILTGAIQALIGLKRTDSH